MSDHKKRMHEIGKVALPPQGTERYNKLMEKLRAFHETDPAFEKKMKEKFEQAVTIIQAQLKNGAGLPIDQELRYFLNDYNRRTIEFGLNSMPSSFNVLEGFFKYRPDRNFFELLEEEDYQFSLFHFTDYITSPKFLENPKILYDHIVEDVNYNFNNIDDLEEITFTTEDGEKYAIGGVSIVRHGDEVIIFMLTGQQTDTIQQSAEINALDVESIIVKEYLKVDESLKQEAVPLFGNPAFWKTLAYCRVDLKTLNIDARYVQQDIGNALTTTTDDPSIISPEQAKLFEQYKDYKFHGKEEIVAYAPIFELATKCLYLPYYFDQFDEQITEREYDTELEVVKRRKGFFKRDQPILPPEKFRFHKRTVWSLALQGNMSADRLYFGENDFKVQKSGYWKPLVPNELGKDKEGKEIYGRTWVDKTLSWYEKDKQTLVANVGSENAQAGSTGNEGYIYLMRNASHPINVFKIGLTTKTTKERAKQLSGTTGALDKFLVANEWHVSDCVLAEKLIHNRMEKNRMNEGREFFQVDYQEALKIITETVDQVNKQFTKIP